ncbi:hypothetical protein F2Q68_00039150 [Brassica cretica]|uniref:Uncharacterized protein n=1 Tax=Brassica cretica TaxID=69181 RepID=A0A8S9MEN5_BRACR|nr:hypothetical protein F2Q68_00039150 [Brassica cretica]
MGATYRSDAGEVAPAPRATSPQRHPEDGPWYMETHQVRSSDLKPGVSWSKLMVNSSSWVKNVTSSPGVVQLTGAEGLARSAETAKGEAHLSSPKCSGPNQCGQSGRLPDRNPGPGRVPKGQFTPDSRTGANWSGCALSLSHSYREIKEGREHRTVGEISDQGTVRSRLTGDQGWILDGRNKGRTRRRRTLQGNVRLRSVMLSMVHCPPPRLNRPDVWDGCVGSILSVLSTCYSYFIYNLIESVGSDSTRPNLGLGRLGEILHGLGLEDTTGSRGKAKEP